MSLDKRIEALEKEHFPKGLSIHLINCEHGESEERAKQRYCEDNEMTTEEFENHTPTVGISSLFGTSHKTYWCLGAFGTMNRNQQYGIAIF